MELKCIHTKEVVEDRRLLIVLNGIEMHDEEQGRKG